MRRLRAGALLAGLPLALAGLAAAAVIQMGGLRVTVLSQVQPFRLPRSEPAPIAVFVSGHLASVDKGIPPQLRRLTVEVNRHGVLRSRGLPVCRLAEVQPSTTARALDRCGDALVGSGRFWAHIVLPGQDPYPTRGRLLIFNGREDGRRAMFAHIFTRRPFASSFVVVFRISRVRQGTYGTRLTASLPQTLGEWGYVDRIKLTLRRKFRSHGKQASYFNAACPAPRGTRIASFSLARATFFFAERAEIAVSVPKTCGVRGK